MFCSQCGVEIPADARFCSQCGTPLAAVQEAAVTGAAAASRTPSAGEEATAPATGDAARGQASGAGGTDPKAFAQPDGLPGKESPGSGVLETGAVAQTGLPKNVAGLLCYVLGWLTGIIFLFIEKDPFVRFHAVQSIIVFGGLTVLSIVFSILTPLGWWRLWYVFSFLHTLIWLGSFVLWIFLMVKAYQGQRYKLPVVGDLAGRYAG